MDFQDKLRRLKEASMMIDSLYKKEWFADLSTEERVRKINDILVSVTSVNDIVSLISPKKEGKWDEETRKDNPHHYNNRLD